MNTLFKLLVVPALLLHATYSPAQILVGTLASGEPELRLNDAELNTRLAFTLGGTTLQNAVIYSGSDIHGVYYYVRADGVRVGQNVKTRVAVILSQREGNLVFDTESGCVIECIPQQPGTSCDLNIRERCKQQTCTPLGIGGCNVRVIFPATPD